MLGVSIGEGRGHPREYGEVERRALLCMGDERGGYRDGSWRSAGDPTAQPAAEWVRVQDSWRVLGPRRAPLCRMTVGVFSVPPPTVPRFTVLLCHAVAYLE